MRMMHMCREERGEVKKRGSHKQNMPPAKGVT